MCNEAILLSEGGDRLACNRRYDKPVVWLGLVVWSLDKG